MVIPVEAGISLQPTSYPEALPACDRITAFEHEFTKGTVWLQTASIFNPHGTNPASIAGLDDMVLSACSIQPPPMAL